MSTLTLEERLRRAEEVLARVAAGDFEARLEVEDYSNDAIGGLEMGINFLIVDLRSADRANQEKARALASQQRELQERLAVITAQADSIRKLSTPVIEVWDDILALPLIGVLDVQRSEEIMEALLEKVIASRARGVIIDITGVDLVDTHTASNLLRVVRSVGLVGSYCVVTGISPAVAQTLVQLGTDLGELRALRSLKEGIKDCLEFLRAGHS